ncbi:MULTISPECIES: hypothetical protein [Pseudomonas]|jgi:hypothetical protein|uniref:hypothetical protein n=1 Tax=Pseudomonas TaxID=286 RepID=UPI0013763CD3|nr:MULTISPECIES: hypothetical protein [unclassified Pseudomonas]
MNTTQATVEAHSAGWRFKLGIIILCVMLGSWLLVALAAMVGVAGFIRKARVVNAEAA